MCCELNILDPTGHTNQIWDPNVPAEVEAAKTMYESLKAKGYAAFAVKRDGERGEQIHAFDANAGKIIMAPALRGG